MHARYLLLLFSIVTIDCTDVGSDNSGAVVITTDKDSYGRSETVVFTVRNWGPATAYAWHCNYRLGYGIQKQENGSWPTIGERYMICLAIYASGAQPIVVGQPYTDTLRLATSGTYRLEMGVGWDREKLWDYRIYSNTLRVE